MVENPGVDGYLSFFAKTPSGWVNAFCIFIIKFFGNLLRRSSVTFTPLCVCIYYIEVLFLAIQSKMTNNKMSSFFSENHKVCHLFNQRKANFDRQVQGTLIIFKINIFAFFTVTLGQCFPNFFNLRTIK